MTDWQSRGKRYQRATMAGLAELYGNPEQRTEAQQRLIDEAGAPGGLAPRRRSVQHESAEMQRLAAWVHRHWWAPGWWRWESATMHKREAWRNSSEGVRAGWPDCGLFIPAYGYHTYSPNTRIPVRAVLELKAAHRKPIRGGKGGVTDAQRACLGLLEQCGFETAVCYGADEALAQLVEWAGPRPDVLPEGW